MARPRAGLLDGRDQALGWRVETKQVAIFEEEICYRNIALVRSHIDGIGIIIWNRGHDRQPRHLSVPDISTIAAGEKDETGAVMLQKETGSTENRAS